MVEGFPESIKELDKQIRDLGVADEDVERYLLFEEHPDHFVVKYKSWMAPSLGSLKIKDYLVNQLGATYEAYPKARFIIKKRRKAEVPSTLKDKQKSTDTNVISQEPQPAKTIEYDLKKSFEKYGPLVPIIKDERGLIIDGLHRRYQVSKDWPSVTVPIKDELQFKIARFIINFCRRKMTEKEKRQLVTDIAVLSKWTPKEMAENLPVSYSWIMKYLPDEYKDKEMAKYGRKGAKVKAEVEERQATQPVATFVPCEKCGVNVSEPVHLKGHFFCDRCARKIEEKPALLKELRKPSPPSTRIEKKEWKPPETKEYREALKHPKVSKMEELVALALTEKGVAFQQGRDFCVQSTIPDFYFPQANLVVYLDGVEVHKKRVERDEFLRELLTKRYGIRVLALTYDAVTKEQQDEILQKIVGELGK